MRISVPEFTDEKLIEGERQAIIDGARRYLGVRWQHLGRNAQGLDCAGLLLVVGKDVLGVDIEVSDYLPWPNQQVMREICSWIMIPIKKEEMTFGDVALLYVSGYGVVHLGWFAGKTLIHASNDANVGKLVETTIHPGWKLRSAYAVPRYKVKG